MNGLKEADKALQDFLNEYDSCATCAFWTPELFGGICNAPEYAIGHLDVDTYTCEQHVFKNTVLDKQLTVLVNNHYNAWYIVEGFLYFNPPEAA